jgi:hypothetical protein
MVDVASNWKGGSPTVETIVPLLMFFRAHSAFRCACALGMSGATVEGMGTLRQSLEFAGYASLVHGDRSLTHVLWDTDLSADAEKNVAHPRWTSS